jgi:hypothetical protein
MTRNTVDYEKDFYAWTVEQARLLRSGELSEIDVENIAEEIESMGRSDRREIHSRLVVLLMHLLKWQYQKRARSRSWSSTILTQRREIEQLLAESPSLRPSFIQMFSKAYADARQQAALATGLRIGTFPETCLFTPEEVLTREFLPEP